VVWLKAGFGVTSTLALEVIEEDGLRPFGGLGVRVGTLLFRVGCGLRCGEGGGFVLNVGLRTW